MRHRPMVIAVDGPGGVGKTTASRRLARKLGVPYLSTGVMYRAVGLAVLGAGIDPSDEEAISGLLDELEMEIELQELEPTVRVNGIVQGARLKTPLAAEMASQVATLSVVRQYLVALQQRLAASTGGVIEGRDIGTRVLPDAPYKFFLDASLEVRVQRRVAELIEQGHQVDREDLLARLADRDHKDRTRSDSPLTYDDSYHYIDTSEMTLDQVVGEMLAQVRAGQPDSKSVESSESAEISDSASDPNDATPTC